MSIDNEEDLSRTAEILLQNCYESYKNSGIISCKILNQAEVIQPGGRNKRARSSKSMTVGATFKNKTAAENADPAAVASQEK